MIRRPLPFLRLVIAGLALLCAAVVAHAETSVPKDNGLPVNVEIGVAFVDLLGFDENAGTFRATVDIRLRWSDPRLRDPNANVSTPPQTFTDKAADDRMRDMWIAPVVVANQRGAAAASSYGLRVYPTGTVELIHASPRISTSPSMSASSRSTASIW